MIQRALRLPRSATLSMRATPRVIRLFLYQHSPLPSAVRSVRPRARRGVDKEPAIDDAWLLLTNPDGIVRAIYDLDELRADVYRTLDVVKVMGRMYPKYIHQARVDFNSNGDVRHLESNGVGEIRCNELANCDGEIQYGVGETFSGSIEEFWSPEVLPAAENYIRALHLYCDLPRVASRSGLWNIRTIEAAKPMTNIDYARYLSNLLG